MARRPPAVPTAPARSLKARAIQWLAQREHSRTELRRKLLRHAADECADVADGADVDNGDAENGVDARLDSLLDWLEANHYLSQQRFVESRVHARSARFGNLRIRQELAQHQLGLPADVESALRDTELERARTVWAARFGGRPASVAERGKQARFLAGRGFSGDVIQRVLREAGATQAGETAPGLDAD